ncbi:ribonuclease 3-like [Pistacia vera]|uniref:ribonuclease 3-like n=1 Tax=Pistacia vera TaxID=55513 RepID=UPI001263C1A4|nr:ribonuclease 3-like [Pistacia vera]
MKRSFSIFIKLFVILQSISVLCVSEEFDFFYFVVQWPGSYCDTKNHCCYPKSGKPAADFGIHGLWPNYKDGSYPSNCDPDALFDESQLTDLMSKMQKSWPTLSCPSNDGLKFWSHEWVKHGTCAESELDQREYFEAALKLKDKVNLLQILKDAGIKPDDRFYDLDKIKDAIEEATGFTPGIDCNVDSSHNSQLYQIYQCVDTSGSDFIQCPRLPRSRCPSRVQLPKF